MNYRNTDTDLYEQISHTDVKIHYSSNPS